MAEPRHEQTDVRVGLLAKLGIGLVVLTLVVILAVLGLFRSVVSRETRLEEPRSPLAASPSTYSGPELQVSSGEELQEMLEAKRQVLRSYDWIDREAGVVRIPIEQAIELLAARGLPSTEEDEP